MFDGIGDLVSSAAKAIGGAIGGPAGAMIGGLLADFAMQAIGDQTSNASSNSSLPFNAQDLFNSNFMQAFQGALGR
ncbi:hypothetical protein [Luteimonas sp. R10]|uniref:hypothetical protein n=1 Tax=Luteimonas sp. R10 TaxID=3108176 RepID=UPI003093A0D2|nr:hypothetical protein U3649_01960 [Luteimonas sp. R10]